MQWIISDVHGCIHTLEALLKKVRSSDQRADFVFVGDYADRGKHSKQVVDLVIELQKEGSICLRGNHDDVIDWILNEGHCKSVPTEWVCGLVTPAKVLSWWNINGFLSTLNSYNVVKSGFSEIVKTYDDLRAEFVEKAGEDHCKFYRELKLFWENSTHFACHAYMRPSEELPRDMKFIPSDRNCETLWSRFQAAPNGGLREISVNWDRIGVFGHSPTTLYGSPVPIKYKQIRLIDTGAFLDNYLTAYNCESDDWVLQATDSRDINGQ